MIVGKSIFGLFIFKIRNQPELTKVSHVPHGVNARVAFVKNNEEWRSGNAICEGFTV